jgi:GT2 family glycosyltransferase
MALVSAVIVAYGSEPWLERSVRAVLASEDIDVEVILVDNGCTDDAVDVVALLPAVTIVRPAENLGFAGGCRVGAEAARGEVLVFVNPDAIAAPDALTRLSDVALRPGVGIATASVRLADRPDHLNSAGNEVHFLGLSWSGSFDEPASDHHLEREALAASGAGMAVSKPVWHALGGMEQEFFAYYEDADLSIRCWHQGLRVVYVPDAVVVHRYEFSRNERKLFLAERNRLLIVLTLYEIRTLVLLAPALLALEVAVTALSIGQGWWRQKLAGWRWLVQHRGWVADRRRRLQGVRTVSDRALSSRFAVAIDPGNFAVPPLLKPLNGALGIYWRAVRKVL